MATLKQLGKEIEAIKERNRRVESDKSWETSLERKMAVAGLTYAVVVAFFLAAGLPNPLVNALVPALAFILSTLSLEWFRQAWIKGHRK